MSFKKKLNVLILYDYYLLMLFEFLMFQIIVNIMDSIINKDSFGMMVVVISVFVRMFWEGNIDVLRGGECLDVVIFRSECFSIL